MPPDLKTHRDRVGPSLVASPYSYYGLFSGYYDAYVTGTLANISGTGEHMTYLYDMTNEPTMGHTWKNLLTARTKLSLPGADSYDAEFSGAAYYGDVALIGNGGYLTRSFDDGSTWSSPLHVFPLSSDTSLAYDGQGTLYATNTLALGQIARALPDHTWTSAQPIPPTQATLVNPGAGGDRLWMTADKQRSDFLYITWHGSDDKGHISYCNGTATCDNASAWCPDWSDVLNSSLACGNSYNPACLIEAGGDHVWVLVSGDPAAILPSPYNEICGPADDPTWTCGEDVALHEIDNYGELGPLPGGGCTAPHLGPAHCLYFQDQAYYDNHQLHLETGTTSVYPGNYRGGWRDRLAVSPDGRQVAVSVRGYRDTSTGNPCTPGSSQCRADVFTAMFSDATGWCGSIGCGLDSIAQTGMFVANFDSAPPLAWVDHILPCHDDVRQWCGCQLLVRLPRQPCRR